MTCQIHILDRKDQIDWYVDDSWHSFNLNVKDKKHEIMKWLNEVATGTVIIFGGGELPPTGLGNYPIWRTYEHIMRDNYKIYFEDEASATLFKLTWGGTA